MSYRQRANSILALSFFCFGLVFFWWYTHETGFWEELVFFVVQSALIGSIADWFAVTALFDKPLGVPYHTELIYNHREQLINAMTKVVSEKLLKPHMWEEKLDKFSLTSRISIWLSSEQGHKKFRSFLYEIAERIYGYARKGETQKAIAENIRSYLKKQPIMMFMQDRIITMLEAPDGKILNELIAVFSECVRSKDFEDFLVKILDSWMEDTKRGNILNTVTKFTGLMDNRKIAKDIQQSIVTWLERWQHADANEREWLCSRLEIQMYAMSGQLTYTIQNGQNRFIDTLPIEAWLNGMLRSGTYYFTTGIEGKEKLTNFMENEVMRYVRYCGQYPEVKDWLDEQIRKTCTVILENEHALIGVAVRQVLSGFDKKRFNDFLESKVGEDLAWIRINGALVGASIGFLAFLFLNLFYEPYMVPLMRGILS
ncbi:DUF445 family protein [Megasphaera paucivorans]|uniref:Uncharacterized membrane-anchored protein YjiN, DUF445 family n=1 Tax=Megasphaera paucivorans TaxID=349095 RepID=A0A1G9XLH3_9FIRM|nr:DUF445 family protein [Megasphaera paucivorans]SDM97618.1 Uncharacterized membrane-anchored protein YjiN, DUF445 family [Megasphaera paucivorans]